MAKKVIYKYTFKASPEICERYSVKNISGKFVDENNNDNNGGIYIGRGNKTIKKIEIKDALDITVTNKNNAGTFLGIELNGGSGLEEVIIDRSGGGDITVSAENDTGANMTLAEGVRVTLGKNNIVNI